MCNPLNTDCLRAVSHLQLCRSYQIRRETITTSLGSRHIILTPRLVMNRGTHTEEMTKQRHEPGTRSGRVSPCKNSRGLAILEKSPVPGFQDAGCRNRASPGAVLAFSLEGPTQQTALQGQFSHAHWPVKTRCGCRKEIVVAFVFVLVAFKRTTTGLPLLRLGGKDTTSSEFGC